MFTAKCSLTPRNDTYPFISPDRFKGKLKGKNVVVTGAGRGIGRVSALAFAGAGASVVCIARHQNDIDDVVAEIEKTHNTPAVAISADISDPNAGKTIVKQVEEKLGSIDVLMNNAGVTRYNFFEAEESLDDWWPCSRSTSVGPYL